MSIRNLDKLINKYIEAAILQGKATNEAKSKTGNQQYTIISKIYHQLKNDPEVGLLPLVKLLNHSNDYVRLWAAAHTLSINPEKAEKVLMELSDKKPFWGFNAKMTLQEWKKGSLNF